MKHNTLDLYSGKCKGGGATKYANQMVRRRCANQQAFNLCRLPVSIQVFNLLRPQDGPGHDHPTYPVEVASQANGLHALFTSSVSLGF